MKLGNGSTNGKCILKKSLLALFQAIIEYFSDWTYTTKKMNFEKLLDIKFARKNFPNIPTFFQLILILDSEFNSCAFDH